MQQREVDIINKLGLHARASSKFTQISSRFKAEVWIARNGRRVNGKSIMGVMMLAAAKGATVELEDENSGEQVKYQIVGEDEADLKLGLVNISSPIARALIGKEEGDTAEVSAPGGAKSFEIVSIDWK